MKTLNEEIVEYIYCWLVFAQVYAILFTNDTFYLVNLDEKVSFQDIRDCQFHQY